MKVFFVFAFCLSLFFQRAYASFDFNQNCVLAYKKILNLELGEGRSLIQQEHKENPQNQIPVLLENYIDFFTLLSSENKDEFDRLKGNMDIRLEAIQRGDRNSPYFLYSQAVINLQWALIKAKFQEYWGAVWEIKHASSALEENSKKFPAFTPADLDRGVLLALLGSFPSNMRVAMNTFGLKGDTPSGLNLMERTLKKLKASPYEFFSDETALYLSFIQASITEDPLTFKESIDRCAGVDHKSLLRTYVLGYVALRTAHTDEAIDLLANRPSGKTYADFPVLDYMLGTAKLNRMDTDATLYFQLFQTKYRGISFIKDSWLRLAWIAQIKNDQAAYQRDISRVLSNGFDYTEKDKQAEKEAKEGRTELPLLKARLYFDGGYYTKALAELDGKKLAAFSSQKSRLEFFYRQGRIQEALGNSQEAEKNYQEVIEKGKYSALYFAANSALRMGGLYEKKGDRARARIFYQEALDMHEEEYKSSLDNKAKDGLRRVGK